MNIKVCPICGGKGLEPKAASVILNPTYALTGWHVACESLYKGCMCQGNYEDTPEKAIEAWNRRATASEGTVRDMIHLLEFLKENKKLVGTVKRGNVIQSLSSWAIELITRAENELKGGKM